jgi:hypothetical protein
MSKMRTNSAPRPASPSGGHQGGENNEGVFSEKQPGLRRTAMAGSIRSPQRARRRTRFLSSSVPASRPDLTTSVTRIAASFRVSLIAPGSRRISTKARPFYGRAVHVHVAASPFRAAGCLQRVDLTRSPSRRRMAGVCAQPSSTPSSSLCSPTARGLHCGVLQPSI